jgi:acetyl-CoA carboxylase biotin carboxylase subunit
MFSKILIANRGEIAVRIIRACKEMGIQTVAVYSEADKKCLHVKMADESFCIGKASSAESYLQSSEIVVAAIRSGAQAIHPGYGFLSENAEFAELCIASKLAFIGPTPETIRKMGDKSVARQTMKFARIPILPGTKKPITEPEEAVHFVKKIGYPILIKPSAGGGGNGMRIVHHERDLVEAIYSSQTESKAAFGDDTIYIERFIYDARHIEFQILADNHGNIVHLGERECSVQRRHQKLVEEAPSVALNASLRAKMGRVAIKAAKAVNYTGAGTVEFLLDKDQMFYFIEMNTRIQVEHPITEYLTGIDLVKAQIQIAFGENLNLTQRKITFNGHAIECRINAEDPHENFMPSPGKITGLGLPGGPGVRVDTHIYCGYEVPDYYDSLLVKLIVHAQNRQIAIERMKQALDECSINNVKTTISFLLRVMNDHRFISGDYSTSLLDLMKTDDNHHNIKGVMQNLTESLQLWPDEDE